MTRANLHYKNRPKIMSFFLKNLSEGYLQGTQSDLTDICENAQSAVLQASFKVTCRQNFDNLSIACPVTEFRRRRSDPSRSEQVGN